jgi:mevalonate kinase
MWSYDFQTTTHGKWILAGEHAVLRGKSALVFPMDAKKLTLVYNAATKNLSADFEGIHGEALHLLFWSVLEHGLRLLNRALNQIQGFFKLSNSIPIGVGMGASAALCVAVTRWFIDQGWLKAEDEFNFAKSLEDLFHGKSSGLDIVGVSASSGMEFQNGKSVSIQQSWQPKWCLTSSGQPGLTSPCIAKVEALWKQDLSFARSIDERMQQSVDLARMALTETTSTAKIKLAGSMELAASCFRDWGLVSEVMALHIDGLKLKGALAVKPTGSGGGGYVLSLWNDYPSESLITGCNEWIRI